LEQLHRYVIDERGPRLETRRCARDECFALAMFDVALDFVAPSGAVSAGPKSPLCRPHVVDWLRWSLLD
jgi:hypothetical protein